jgi:xanthine dehydrogenase accessory factor
MTGQPLVLIRGAGDLASGVAYRLAMAGLRVVMTDLAKPTMVRTTVSYGAAILHGAVVVEGIYARRATLAEVPDVLAEGIIPVLIDPEKEAIRTLKPDVVIDGRVAKAVLDTQITDAPLVVGLGPGFTAGVDCHAVVETNRGHWLGRVYWSGSAEPDTGIPGAVNGKTTERVLRAPADGLMQQVKVIGCMVRTGELLARIGDAPLLAPFDGVIRGLIDDDVFATQGMKIGDLDPRAAREHCFTISDKSLAIGGGVVEAVLSFMQSRVKMVKLSVQSPE